MQAQRLAPPGKGIGPTYEDKVSRRALRVYDLFDPKRLPEKLSEVLDYHNFVLTQYLGAGAGGVSGRFRSGDGRC